MGSFIKTMKRLSKEKRIIPPRFLIDNLHYATIMGSVAYGVSSDSSDMDIYGFCMPPKEVLFPHLVGVIPGFGQQIDKFEQYQEHHVIDPSSQTEYDITIYNIVKYFDLCMENNPNMIDSLFTPRRCVLHSTPATEIVRERRKEFLHKGAMSKLRGYAYSQLSKAEGKSNSRNPKRQADIERNGYDTKFLYHVVRLVLQAEQILAEGDLDLERNRDILKSIRRGEWELSRLTEYFVTKEKSLEELYAKSNLREVPDENNIKSMLLQCLEHHYGSLDKLISKPTRQGDLLIELEKLVEKYR
jgi:predicted nucleotidyltransferase